MFDNDPSLPASGSRLNQAWLRFRGKDRWLSTTGTVYSVEWRGLSNQVDSPVGYYDVVFSYRATDQIYTGKFSDYGMEAEGYLHPDNTIEIRYDPSHPQRNYYPELRTYTNYRLLCFSVGVTIAIVVMVIAYLRGNL
jgi:hypothetical protein